MGLLAAWILTGCDQEPRRLMAQAEGRWRRGDYLGAIQDYRKIIEEHPKSALADDAYYWIGAIEALYLHDYTHAALTYQQLIHTYPTSPRSLEAQRALAELYETKLQNPRRAITEYEKLIEKSHNPIVKEEIQYRIGEVYLSLGDLDQARTEWELLAKQSPQGPWTDNALYRIGTTYLLQGQPQVALKVYQDLLTRYPGTEMRIEARLGIAQCLEETERLEEALMEYHRLQPEYPNPKLIELKIRNLERRLGASQVTP